jgi:hypothetical protein
MLSNGKPARTPPAVIAASPEWLRRYWSHDTDGKLYRLSRDHGERAVIDAMRVSDTGVPYVADFLRRVDAALGRTA